jgi:hypothetical protein
MLCAGYSAEGSTKAYSVGAAVLSQMKIARMTVTRILSQNSNLKLTMTVYSADVTLLSVFLLNVMAP